MRTISDYVFELAQNSMTAGAENISITVDEDKERNLLTITVEDDGKGIKTEALERIKGTFFTTRDRKKRHVGLGLSLLDAACKGTNGALSIESEYGRHTKVSATMELDHIDRPPLGDLPDLYAHLFVSGTERKIIWMMAHMRNGTGYHLKNSSLQRDLNIITLSQPGIRDEIYAHIREMEKALG